MANGRGAIVHVELPATDRAAAGQFYSELFGWQINEHPEMNYTTFQADGGPGGGFVSACEQVKAGDVRVYVATDDIDGTLADVERLGGKTLMPKMPIPNVGAIAIFADPTGNAVGLFTGGQ